jgi:hypothetical protein
MSSFIITEEMINELIERTESTPPDISLEVKVGDWVRLDLPDYMEYYRTGHVSAISIQSNDWRLGYGQREDPEYMRTYNGWVSRLSPVIEHWRKIPCVVREGNSITVDSEWVQIPLVGAL